MLKNNKKNDEFISKSTLICCAIFLFAVIFVVIFDNGEDIGINDTFTKDNINALINKIDKNYTLDVIKYYNTEEIKYTYYTDGNIELYETDSLDYGYVKYNDMVYKMTSDNLNVSRIYDYPVYINDNYSNYNFIKNVFNKCEYEYISNTSVNCKLLETDFLNEYNNYYGRNINTISSNYMNIKINYVKNINSIEIDYSNIDNIINGGYNSIKYKLTFSNIGKNNFSKIIEYISSKL